MLGAGRRDGAAARALAGPSVFYLRSPGFPRALTLPFQPRFSTQLHFTSVPDTSVGAAGSASEEQRGRARRAQARGQGGGREGRPGQAGCQRARLSCPPLPLGPGQVRPTGEPAHPVALAAAGRTGRWGRRGRTGSGRAQGAPPLHRASRGPGSRCWPDRAVPATPSLAAGTSEPPLSRDVGRRRPGPGTGHLLFGLLAGTVGRGRRGGRRRSREGGL